MSRVRALWRRLCSPFEEFGAGVGLLYAADRAMRSLSPRLGLQVYEMMVQPVSDKPLLPSGLARHLAFAELGAGHPDVERMPARPEIKRQRFEQGATCLGAYRKGELIGYIWFCRDRYDEDEVRCTYLLADATRSVFDFDLYVLPEHRMGTAFTAVWHGANAYLRERGIRYSVSRMTRFNLGSRRAHLRLGARRAARAVFVQAWKVELMVAGAPPFVALTWRPTQRCELSLSPAMAGLPAEPEVAAAGPG